MWYAYHSSLLPLRVQMGLLRLQKNVLGNSGKKNGVTRVLGAAERVHLGESKSTTSEGKHRGTRCRQKTGGVIINWEGGK